jgi:hypothetical protein
VITVETNPAMKLRNHVNGVFPRQGIKTHIQGWCHCAGGNESMGLSC